MKKLRMMVRVIFVVALILNYIPIKFAQKVNFIDNNYINTENEIYICEFTQTTDGVWLASTEYNKNLNEPIIFNDLGSISPLNKLSKEFTTDYLEPTNNKYLFNGNNYSKDLGNGHIVNNMQIKSWDIIYPIQRKSIKGLFTPKSYLTIYDFNWINVVKNWFSTK